MTVVVVVGIQSPIPLIYLRKLQGFPMRGWDSVTYPLDILDRDAADRAPGLGFSHLSP